jgi:hypothetical protein
MPALAVPESVVQALVRAAARRLPAAAAGRRERPASAGKAARA